MLRIFSYVCWLNVCLPWKMSLQVLSFLTGLSGFSNSHLWMWELDHKEGWVTKKWYFQVVVLEKTLESPLDCKEIKPVNLKGNQPRIFIGRTDAEAETAIFWTPVAKSRTWLSDWTEVNWMLKRWPNQLFLKEISPEYLLEGLILKLKLQYFGHLMERAYSLEKPWCWETLRARGEGGSSRRDGWMTSLTQWTWV